ncbi:hypothetical protein E6C70_09710 [Glaciibacter flavus]|uniref:Uncharacterized protein n=1 Tax=Orlajensenia flava TaxID=2565934 RepID=A0A4S4FW46_9MICO|nr:hypothetical protein [Glaciibacter flavus]THG34521.1 hypothetical protein E6C70_09710 [Glaciibacter flavus]
MVENASDGAVMTRVDGMVMLPSRHRGALRHVSGFAVVVAALLFAGSVVLAILSEVQSDYFGTRSEASGGFDSTVFPPFDDLTWLMAMVSPLLTGACLALTITLRRLTRPYWSQ